MALIMAMLHIYTQNIYTTSHSQIECDTKSFFKKNAASFNSVLFFLDWLTTN